jgi:hypothetical protein
MTIRELTAKEKRELRRMVKAMCANYDSDYGCLFLDSACFMLGKAYTGGALCKWFRNALMPLCPEMKRLLEGGTKQKQNLANYAAGLLRLTGGKSTVPITASKQADGNQPPKILSGIGSANANYRPSAISTQ